MAIKLPDYVEHNNPSYPIALAGDIAGTTKVIVGAITNPNLLAIPAPKRAVGTMVFSTDTEKYYSYRGLDVLDANWGDTANWPQVGGGAGGGNLELDGGVDMSTTPVAVSDTSGNNSQLFLATDKTQVKGTISIITDNETYMEIDDVSSVPRFSISRLTGSQKVDINFISNPTLGATVVGSVRTMRDGSDLYDAMQFLKDGSVIGADTPDTSNFILQKLPNNDLVLYSPFVWGGIQSFPSSGNGNTMLNGLITGTHGGYGNVVIGLGTTLVADGSAYNFNVVIGQGSFTRGGSNVSIGNYAMCGEISTLVQRAVAIGYNSQAYGDDCITLGSDVSKVHLGGNFSPDGRLHIKGFGTTSSTRSFIAQNTSGSEKATIYDDGAMVLSAAAKVPSAKLQVDSESRGFLPPRMTDTQVRAISSPADGLVVYNTTISHLCVFQGGNWVKINHSPM